MIAVISDDRKFSKRCCDILDKMGFMTTSISHQFAKRALHCGAKAAIVHSGKDRSLADKSTLALSKSDFKGKPIIAVLTRNVSLAAKYIELEGSTDQINLPCSDSEISELVLERCNTTVSYKRLTLGGTRRKAELLIEREAGGWFEGHAKNYLPLKIKADKDIVNSVVEIEIKEENLVFEDGEQ